MGWLVCGKRERKCHANAVGPTVLTTGATGGNWVSPPLDCFYKVVGNLVLAVALVLLRLQPVQCYLPGQQAFAI